MPSPSSSLATLRPDLAQSLEEFDLVMDQAGFIGLDVCPVIEVDRASGNFGRIPLEQLLQSPDLHRAPGSGYNRTKFKFEPDTYATTEKGVEEPVDDNEAKMYADYFDAEAISAMRARDFVMRGYEMRVAAMFFNTANFTNTGAVTTPWSTPATAVPITDVETAVLAVYTASGLWPNAMVMNRKVFRKLRTCAQITDLVKYSGLVDPRAGQITTAVLSEVFDIENIFVAGGSKNTANEGQTAIPSQIWSDSYVWVGHVRGGPDPRVPSAARTFHWGADGSTIGGTFETYRDETIRGEVVRMRHQTQEKLMLAQAGYLLSGVLV